MPAPSGQGHILILLTAVRGKFQCTRIQRPVKGFYCPNECNEQYHPVLLPAVPAGGFLLTSKQKLQICGSSLRKGTRTSAPVNPICLPWEEELFYGVVRGSQGPFREYFLK